VQTRFGYAHKSLPLKPPPKTHPKPRPHPPPHRCYHRATLYSFANHYETGEPLPEAMFERLKAAKNYRSGTMTLRQVHFATVDLELHSRFTPGQGETIFDYDRKVS